MAWRQHAHQFREVNTTELLTSRSRAAPGDPSRVELMMSRETRAAVLSSYLRSSQQVTTHALHSRNPRPEQGLEGSTCNARFCVLSSQHDSPDFQSYRVHTTAQLVFLARATNPADF